MLCFISTTLKELKTKRKKADSPAFFFVYDYKYKI